MSCARLEFRHCGERRRPDLREHVASAGLWRSPCRAIPDASGEKKGPERVSTHYICGRDTHLFIPSGIYGPWGARDLLALGLGFIAALPFSTTGPLHRFSRPSARGYRYRVTGRPDGLRRPLFPTQSLTRSIDGAPRHCGKRDHSRHSANRVNRAPARPT